MSDTILSKLHHPSSPARRPSHTDDQRWAAVLQRDASADGVFVYCVRTTGVYCRPSCSARRPRRENVAFHNSSIEAENAGFRPCKRCQPGGPALEQHYAATVAKACRIIKNSVEPPCLEALAKAVGMSPFHFHRLFKKITGLTPKAYATAHRAERLRTALHHRPSVTEAIYEAGFNSNSRFYEKSSEMLGMNPKAYRKGGQGAAIRFAVGQCSLGSVLVAASAKGVCAIFLGDDPDRLVKDLQDQFPRADLVGGDSSFERLVAQVVGLIESPTSAVDLPLDIQGTAFQQKVWTALREIPPGKTVSYSELSRRLGIPKSFRAVAGACAANSLAVAIPCHRVVRTNGDLSGYRWGLDRKHALLRKEFVACG